MIQKDCRREEDVERNPKTLTGRGHYILPASLLSSRPREKDEDKTPNYRLTAEERRGGRRREED